jgi:hypothetical protein
VRDKSSRILPTLYQFLTCANESKWFVGLAPIIEINLRISSNALDQVNVIPDPTLPDIPRLLINTAGADIGTMDFQPI